MTLRSQILISSCKFLENSATFSGGSIYLYRTGNIKITNNKFYKNQAKIGGAIYYFEDRKNIFLLFLFKHLIFQFFFFRKS